MTGQTTLNFKGLIIANGFTNFKVDAVTVEVLANFNLIPISLYELYQKNECFVAWSLFYQHNLLPEPSDLCYFIWSFAQSMINYQIDDLNARIYMYIDET